MGKNYITPVPDYKRDGSKALRSGHEVARKRITAARFTFYAIILEAKI